MGSKKIPYGFGGIASLGKGMLPAENVIAERYRLGSTCTILSRSFCSEFKNSCKSVLSKKYGEELKKIRDYELFCEVQNDEFFQKNRQAVKVIVADIVSQV